MTDIFVSKANDTGELAGVFEADNDASYFYLYRIANKPTKRVVGAVNIFSGNPDFTESEIEIRWLYNDTIVGLFIRAQLWGYFDVLADKGHAGDYPKHALKLPTTLPQ